MAELRPESRDVAVIVATFNGAAWMPALLESVHQSTLRPILMVVDNCSTDETCARVSESGYGSEVFVLERNAGFGSACNAGMERAINEGAKYVFLLNQDARLAADTLKILREVADRNPEYGVLSPLHCSYEGDLIDPHIYGYLGDARPSLVSDLYFGRKQEIYDIPFMPAAGWLVRTEALRQVGGFDPLYFMYGEDVDLCRRMEQSGFKIGLVPSALIYHWHGGPKAASAEYSQAMEELYWQAVLWLKDRRVPLWKSVLGFARESAARLLRKLVYFDLQGVGREVLLFGKILVGLPRIIRHRNLSMRRGSFLNLHES